MTITVISRVGLGLLLNGTATDTVRAPHIAIAGGHGNEKGRLLIVPGAG